MGCKAFTNSDGSWYCASCQIGGDRDEPVEEFCRGTDRGTSVANRSPVDQEGLDERLEAHAAQNRQSAKGK